MDTIHELVYSELGIRERNLLHIRICFDFRETTTSMASVVPNWLHDPCFEVDNERLCGIIELWKF
jgi:hypothetical protein